jgi:thymidylate synthase (FAD)
MTQHRDKPGRRHDSEPIGRPQVAALDAILGQVIPVLDHGFVRVIDYMGDDAAIVQAARVSYGTGTKTVKQDAALIRYLLRNGHTTPFEMCEIKLHVKLPIFVARQWIRHRTANVNEYSARYSILDNEFYLPSAAHIASQSTSNRQGREKVLSKREAARVTKIIRTDAARAYAHYLELLNEDVEGGERNAKTRGLARELARINLPVNFYTQWYWKIDLHNFMHFLELRNDSHAQYEIRSYAQKLTEILNIWVPLASAAFEEYRLAGVRLSATATRVIQRLILGEEVTEANSGLSHAEWLEFQKKFLPK